MDKYEFVRQLNASLKGKISEQELNDIMVYYQDYIDTEIKKGRSETEVLEVLGSPRLLARSIEETKQPEYVKEDYEDTETYYEEKAKKIRVGKRMVPVWLVLLLVILGLVVVLAVVFKILIALLPVILVGSAVMFVYRKLKKR